VNTYAKTPLEIAAEIYGIDPRRFGEPKILRWGLAEVGATSIGQPVSIQAPQDLLICALSGQPNDGAAASFAGLELDFRYGDIDLVTDGKTAQRIPFSMLAGRGPGPSQAGGPWYAFKIPILIQAGTPLTTSVRNRTAGALTPSVAIDTVLLRSGR